MSMLLIEDIGFEGGLYGDGIFYAEGTGHEVGSTEVLLKIKQYKTDTKMFRIAI